MNGIDMISWDLFHKNTYLNIASSNAINWIGRTAPRAVNGPFDGMTSGSLSSPSANDFLSVMIITSAPRALTSSAAVRMWWAWSSSKISMMMGVAPSLPLSSLSMSANGPCFKAPPLYPNVEEMSETQNNGQLWAEDRFLEVCIHELVTFGMQIAHFLDLQRSFHGNWLSIPFSKHKAMILPIQALRYLFALITCLQGHPKANG